MVHLAKALPYIIGAIALAALLAIAYYAGGQGCKAKVAEARAEAFEEAKAKSEKILGEYYANLEKMRNENSDLRDKITTLVEDIPVCQYSSDVILQLDKARGVPEAASSAARAAAAPATDLSRPGAVDRWAADVLQCRQWREQLLALIAFHND